MVQPFPDLCSAKMLAKIVTLFISLILPLALSTTFSITREQTS
jgi:hypothetical protein